MQEVDRGARRRRSLVETREPTIGVVCCKDGRRDAQRCCEGPPVASPLHSLNFAHSGILQLKMSLLVVDSLGLPVLVY
jgi:hypothetical protein